MISYIHECDPWPGKIFSMVIFQDLSLRPSDPPYIDTCSDGRSSKSVRHSPR